MKRPKSPPRPPERRSGGLRPVARLLLSVTPSLLAVGAATPGCALSRSPSPISATGSHPNSGAGESEQRAAEESPPPALSPLLPPPPPARATAPRDRRCEHLGSAGRFCHERRRDWAKVLVKLSPGEGSIIDSPEEAFLLGRWLERAIESESEGAIFARSPAEPVCGGALVCFWAEPAAVGDLLDATLDVFDDPPVGEFYLARLDAAADYEAASQGEHDPRAMSAALLLQSPRGRRFAQRDHLTPKELAQSTGPARIRQLDLNSMARDLRSWAEQGLVELAGPIDDEQRAALTARALAWTARAAAAPTTPNATTSKAPGPASDETKGATSGDVARLVVVEDAQRTRARLVLVPEDANAKPSREKSTNHPDAELLPASVHEVFPASGCRAGGGCAAREWWGAREFTGDRGALMELLERRGWGKAQTEEAISGPSWLAILWAPPVVEDAVVAESETTF